MAVTWLAAGKLVLANLDTIVGVTKPLFTRKKVESLPSQTDLINQLISELQAASSSNTEQIKELATQLKQVVTGLDQAELNAAAEREKARRLVIAAISISILSLMAAIVPMLVR